MPLSRQTSRIVWPSKPSTTRPSTSMRMRGVDCGRCGDCVSSRRSASESRGRRRRRRSVAAGRPSGRARVSVIGRPRSRPAGVGWRGRTADSKYRIPLVSGRVARRSWSHSADATMSCGQVRRRAGRRRAGQAGLTPIDDLGESLCPDPARDRLAARLVRAEPGQHPDELEEVGPVVDDARGTPSRDAHRPRAGCRTHMACRAHRVATARPTARR